MSKEIEQVCITFPEIELKMRHGHKLRGFFGNQFKECQVLHNHDGDSYNYEYPKIQISDEMEAYWIL